jgi:acyl carrier protein
LELFDRALGRDEAVVTALHLDLGEVAAVSPVLPLWRGLAWRPEGRDRLPAAPLAADDECADQGGGTLLTKRLEDLRASERQRVLVDAVRAEAAVVLGYEVVDEVAVNRSFKDMGVDSLTAVELRNRLNALTGLALTTTAVFDHPTVEKLAGEIDRRLAPLAPLAPLSLSLSLEAPALSADAVRRQLADLEAMVVEVAGLAELTEAEPIDPALAADLRAGLRRALEQLAGSHPPVDGGGERAVEDELDGADAAAVLDFIDREFGRVDPT